MPTTAGYAGFPISRGSRFLSCKPNQPLDWFLLKTHNPLSYRLLKYTANDIQSSVTLKNSKTVSLEWTSRMKEEQTSKPPEQTHWKDN